MKTLVIVLLLLPLGITGASAQVSDSLLSTAGVSQQLAQHRKKTLTDLHYAIRLHIPGRKDSAIAASETISFNYKKAGRPLLIDFKETADHVHSIAVNGKAIPIIFNTEHLLIPEPLLKAGHNSITLQFTAGNLSLNRNDDYLYTLLVPDRARTVFPCFDQPDLKATFQLTLTVPGSWRAISNAPVAKISTGNTSKTVVFQRSDKISTYLFSFAAGQFSEVTKTIYGRTMHFLHRETDSSKLRLSFPAIFQLHYKAIKFLEQYTLQPFPFKKLDFIAIPDFQYGGMEHVGAIQYKAASLFLDSGATKDQLNARANLIAHETAHMWFGDLVTMQWFNDVWTKEVFANFMADKINGHDDAGAYDLKFLLDHYPAAYAVDRTAGANPIRQPLANLQEAGSLYGNIIYHKAPVMMRQLELLMGEVPFRNGLREYLATYKFSNATWPNLVAILDRYTGVDLLAWNKVWVNQPGRPIINYNIKTTNGKIAALNITQQPEAANAGLLPQTFNVALVYQDTTVQIPVQLNQANVQVKPAEGKKAPEFIVLNSNGIGYGLFAVDTGMSDQLNLLRDPVVRATAYINLYENMLNSSVKPANLLNLLLKHLPAEPNELVVNLLSGYITDLYWRMTLPPHRVELTPIIQEKIWQTMLAASSANIKKILFKTYQSIALTDSAKTALYSIWLHKTPPAGVTSTEEDYTSLALNLAVKDYADTTILQKEYSRISNADRKKRLAFLMPAVSGNVAVRDSFFNALQFAGNREKESWVASALTYLHHPLRINTSIQYLQKSLELLPEIQATGDIFFPAAWLNSTFYAYNTAEAANVVRKFLSSHPNFNKQLQLKLLQATDPLFRAEKILYGAN